ncbi:transcription antitermination factor NusB [bacterium]|nr:MAG: transcription antitermination factor NusB [bacterium]
MQNRREIREAVLKSLYATEFSGESADEILTKVLRPQFQNTEKSTLDFAEKLYLKTLKLKDEANTLIEKYLKNWELERLASIDRIALHMGISEFLFFDDIPTKVTINEYIEVAKKYSTYKSGKFVNGILDSVLNELKQENKIKKTGRGLIESKI